MSKQEIRIECLSEILEEVGLTASKEQIEKIVNDFSMHLEMENELSSYQHVGYKEECSKCKILEDKLRVLEKENKVFSNSVKQRRKTDIVWIEGDYVMYGGR